MTKTEIYISAYPRSGSAWLTRLLNDILPRDEYVVRRGHFTLKNGELSAGKFYELDDSGDRRNPKRLDLSKITDERIIVLIRDPRDICVSGAWLWQQPVEQFLDRMILGDIVRCGRWDEYCDNFATTTGGSYLLIFGNVISTAKYEHLLSSPTHNIRRMIAEIALTPIGDLRIIQAVACQSFSALKSKIGNDEQALRKAGLRKGIAGDWRNYFTEEMNDKIWSEFGWMMERLGYEK